MLPAASGFAATGQAILAAATFILPDLEHGRAIDLRALRAAMETAFHRSDADGVWDWKAVIQWPSHLMTAFPEASLSGRGEGRDQTAIRRWGSNSVAKTVGLSP